MAGRGDALTRGFLILDSLFLIEESARGGLVARCPLKRSGLSGLGVRLRIAHAKAAKVGKESRYGNVRMCKCGFELGNLGSGGISEAA